MHCGNYPAQREGKAQLCSALLCVCFARLLQPGVKAGLFFFFYSESESGNNGRWDVFHAPGHFQPFHKPPSFTAGNA